MNTTPPIRVLQSVASRIVPGCKLLRTRRLQGGLSADMTLLTIERNDGSEQQMILRQLSAATFAGQPDAAINEFHLLELLQLNGLPTPVPYYLDQSGEILSTPYLVVEYIPGEVDLSSSDLKGRILQMAEQLAHIHSIDLSAADYSFLANAPLYCDEALNEQVSTSDPGMDLDRVVEVLQSHDKTVNHNLPVLLHGDFWPGNILWQSGHLKAIIDWEDAQLGDPLIDLAISRLDLFWIFGTEAMLLFTHHYDSLVRPDLTNLPYWDLCAALRMARLVAGDLAGWAAFFQPYGRQDISGDSIRISCRLFIDQALNELE